MALAKIMAYLGLDRRWFDAGLAGARAQLSRFGQGLSRGFGAMGGMFKTGLVAAFGVAVAKTTKAVIELANEARRTGDYSIISEGTVRNIESATWHIENLKNGMIRAGAAAVNFFSNMLGFGRSADEGARLAREQADANATAEIQKQRALLKLSTMDDERRLKVLEDQARMLKERANHAGTELQRQQLLLQVDQAIIDADKIRAKLANDRAKAAENELKAASIAKKEAAEAGARADAELMGNLAEDEKRIAANQANAVIAGGKEFRDFVKNQKDRRNDDAKTRDELNRMARWDSNASKVSKRAQAARDALAAMDQAKAMAGAGADAEREANTLANERAVMQATLDSQLAALKQIATNTSMAGVQ